MTKKKDTDVEVQERQVARAEEHIAVIQKSEVKPTESIKVSDYKNVSVVYVGPSIRNIASQNTVYTNGIGDALQQKVNEFPFMKGLIVPVSEYAPALMEINRGGVLSMLFKKAMEIA